MSELKKIMYVEDDPDIQEMVSMVLGEMTDFDLRICSSGMEALQMLKSFAPQLIMLDVTMPGMTGTQVLRAIRSLSRYKDTPALFITARVQKKELEDYEKLGAIATIVKPFDSVQLTNKIEEVWRKVDAA